MQEHGKSFAGDLVWLAAVGAALAADVLWWADVRLLPIPHLPGGGGALAVVLAVVSAARIMNCARSELALLLLWLTAAALADVVLLAPDALETLFPRHGDVGGLAGVKIMRWVLVWAAVVLWAKLVLLRRLASISRVKPQPEPGAVERLLGTQTEDLTWLCEELEQAGPREPGRVVQFTGRWGDGKSFLLGHLESMLRLRAVPHELAVTFVDVWKHENEPDLHLAIVEQLLTHPAHSRRLGWLQFPLWLLTGSVLRGLRLEMQAKVGGLGEARAPVELPRLILQRAFERIVARARDQNVRIVLVLDEIDRSAPLVAQAAITIVRRSLDQPGVTVVLSYVDAIIRYKAFNPLVTDMPDLLSTSLAVIYEDMVDGAQGRPIAALAGSAAYAASPPKEHEADPGRPASLEQMLQAEFVAASPQRRARLEARFTEKFLGTQRVDMRELRLRDVAQLPTRFPSLDRLTLKLLGADRDGVKLEERILTVLEDWSVTKRDLRVPPVRSLDGALFRTLSHAVARPDRPERIEPGMVAALVAAALDAETLGQDRSADAPPEAPPGTQQHVQDDAEGGQDE